MHYSYPAFIQSVIHSWPCIVQGCAVLLCVCKGMAVSKEVLEVSKAALVASRVDSVVSRVASVDSKVEFADNTVHHNMSPQVPT